MGRRGRGGRRSDARRRPVEIITGHGNVGFATACNLGAKRASGGYLLFLNPDAMMPTGGLARLIADGQALRRPWVMGPMIVNPDGTEQQGSRRRTLTPWTAFVEAAKLYRIAPRHPYFRRFNIHDEPRPAAVTPVPVISGACFFCTGGLFPHRRHGRALLPPR